MSYHYYISVTAHINNRGVDATISTPTMEEASELSLMGIDEITQVINNLHTVVSGQLDYLNWGTDLLNVTSEGDVTQYGRYDKAMEIQVTTQSLISFLTELKRFKEHCMERDYYKSIISRAFTNVRANPSRYRRWPSSDLYYLITIDRITVTLSIETEDFHLSAEEYTAQLKRYF
ncbi:hypothetical protein QE422_002904 [Chryseobacterium sp. SORGH_AS 447]|uniref:hypothetical protein n=1 Tax=Chryseobacterium sp. SORGH_AS_0447 TaxID=3041769 RepID=UPI0027861D87|nr:hypothetical protein [Chryseobacterium sp. SORGH_AS_0447]MDQ1162536.1 hypothetical protein [Chryseobacterium sp. SORGH_AS_0447]